MKNRFIPVLLVAVFTAANSNTSHGASHVWSGAVNGNWSVAGNWSSGGAPTNGESPLHLTFPPTATRFTVTNDITGLQVDSLTLTNSNYALHALPGKALTLKGTAGTNLLCSGDCVLESSLGIVLLNTNVINVGANQQLTIKSPISGSGALAKVGAGALNFQGVATNSYTGNTLLLQGNLNLQRGSALNSPALAVPGAIYVGTRTGALNSAVVNLNFSHQLAATGAVFSYKSGRLFLDAGVTQKIGPVKIDGGLIAGNPTSLLTLLGDVTATNSGGLYCPMSLGGTNRTFTVHGGTTWLDLDAELYDGGNNAGLTKLGDGSLSLGRSNNYGGLTLVTEGTLNIEHPFALGRTNAGTVVTNAGTLRFIGSFTTGEALTLGGFGTWNTGSIYADVNTNTWTGPVTLVSDTRMYVLMPQGNVTFTGPISGPGALDLAGDGTLVFAGNAANAYSGATSVSSGRLLLAKTNAIAVAGPLVIGDDETPTNNAIVRLLNQHQIADAAPVTIHSSGWLDLSAAASASDVVGSLAGGGKLSLGVSFLTAGGDNSSTTFAGPIVGPAPSGFRKEGTGVMTLNGNSPSFNGVTLVNGGTLSLNGSQPSSPVTVNAGATLMGNGVAGVVTVAGGTASPGNSTGLLKTARLLLSANSIFKAELNGPLAGVSYDQVDVAGGIDVGTAALDVFLGFSPAPGSQFALILNDGVDAITNTFKDLPEGATLSIGGAQFQISYKGGDGNDIMLTQLSSSAPHIGGITPSGNGGIQLNGTGAAGVTYDVEANTNLSSTNWVKIGSGLANVNGQVSFMDTNAASFQRRFYRFKSP